MLSRSVADLAERQYGVISHDQLIELGVTPSLIQNWLRARRLQPVHACTYALGHRRLRPEGVRLAAVLCFGSEAALSHRSAAAHWNLLAVSQSVVDVSAPRAKEGAPGVRLHRPRRWEPTDRTCHLGVPVTTVSRTLLDIAGCVSFARLERAVNEAQLQQVLDFAELVAAMDRAGRKRGIRSLRAIAARLDPDRPVITASSLEALFLGLVRRHGVPEPMCNTRVLDEKVDFFWPSSDLIVETDGDRFHSTQFARANDRRRDRKLELAGHLVLRFSDRDMLNSPELVVSQVRTGLNRHRGPSARLARSA